MEEIKISRIIQVLLTHKKRFAINGAIVFVLACAYILCFPRYYRAEVLLAPETESSSTLNSLSSIASTFGFNLDGSQGADAISPELYPDLFRSNDFVVGLLSIQLDIPEPAIRTDYFDYLANYQEQTPWAPAVRKIKKLLKPKKKPRRLPSAGADEAPSGLNPFMLSEAEDALVRAVKENITCAVDKKTGIISIMVQDQDPVICAVLADSTKAHLQEFITSYRTNKARIDADYYSRICQSAEEDYEKALQAYAAYADRHSGSTLRQSYVTRRDELEADMQSKLTTLIALRQQQQTAMGKVQERTPAFTVLQGATVPIKPAGPKRMLFVAFMLVLSLAGTYIWLVRKELLRSLGLEKE
ncbi:MAG: chain-length determining protein [Bacteroidaceae bacterium]|nr:chain-length determining protein [Bacteroidaceae bacterium]